MSRTTLITEIQRFAVNDGPGFRTNVFLKGCPMRCAWCHNPETIGFMPDLYWKKRACTQCGACLDACDQDAIEPPVDPAVANAEGSGYHKIIRERCNLCMKCVEACHYGALEIAGKPMSVDEILDEVESDKPFYDNSGGGMTLSGGEPTANADFAEQLLAASRARGIHNCLDTNGYCEWETLERLLEYTDLVLYDLKHLDPEKHRQWVGVDNARCLKNLERLVQTGMDVWVRIPVVPGFNDDVEFHEQAASFLAGLPGGVERVDLLPFHNWCQDKYGWLGIEWSLLETESMEPALLEVPRMFYEALGLFATVGGSGFEESSEATG
ncbi:MAG: glycyl-radical enzyme activating protein [Desulfatibacillaceae bacterium]